MVLFSNRLLIGILYPVAFRHAFQGSLLSTFCLAEDSSENVISANGISRLAITVPIPSQSYITIAFVQ